MCVSPHDGEVKRDIRKWLRCSHFWSLIVIFARAKRSSLDVWLTFFFHLRDAVAIFKANPDIILMNCTYRTNEFEMVLLNVLGVTGMNTMFHLAQATMAGETTTGYEWHLTQLNQVLVSEPCCFPQVVFSDCDEALMNALQIIFPDVPMFCVWHTIADVKKHALRNFAFVDEVDALIMPVSTQGKSFEENKKRVVDTEMHSRR